jgi:hypothetical protein
LPPQISGFTNQTFVVLGIAESGNDLDKYWRLSVVLKVKSCDGLIDKLLPPVTLLVMGHCNPSLVLIQQSKACGIMRLGYY